MRAAFYRSAELRHQSEAFGTQNLQGFVAEIGIDHDHRGLSVIAGVGESLHLVFHFQSPLRNPLELDAIRISAMVRSSFLSSIDCLL